MPNLILIQALRFQTWSLAFCLRRLALDLKALGQSLTWLVVSLALGAVLALVGLRRARG